MSNKSAFVVPFLSKQDRKKIDSDPCYTPGQPYTNKPRVGHALNPTVKGGTGKLFQSTFKPLITTAIDQGWKLLLKYRCAGNRKAIKAGLKNPNQVFIYDDPLFALLNDTLKKSAEEYLTDNDTERKKELVLKAFTCILEVMFDDIYYRTFAKEALSSIVLELAQHPELLDLDPQEKECVFIFSRYREYHMTKQQRAEAYWHYLKYVLHEALPPGRVYEP